MLLGNLSCKIKIYCLGLKISLFEVSEGTGKEASSIGQKRMGTENFVGQYNPYIIARGSNREIKLMNEHS